MSVQLGGGHQRQALGHDAAPRVGDRVRVSHLGVLAALVASVDVLVLGGEEPGVRAARALEQRQRAVSVQLGLRVERREPVTARGGAIGRRRLDERRDYKQRA